MDPHDRYMSDSNFERCFYLQIGASNETMLSHLIENFNQFVPKINEWSNSTMYLRTLYGVLCIFYQTKFRSIPNQRLDYKSYSGPFRKLDVSNAQKVLYTQQLNAENLTLVLDILVLHMTLYYDVPAVLQGLETLQILIHQHLTQDKSLKMMDVKLMDCHINSLLLHQKSSSFSSIGKTAGEKVKELYLKNVELELTSENHKDSQLLSQFLPRLVKLVSARDMLIKIWEIIFTLRCNCGETLSILNSTFDLWFSKESTFDKLVIDRSMEKRLWLLLLKGLSSTIPKQRKEALDLVKKIVDFVGRHKKRVSRFRSHREIRPPICMGNHFQQYLFTENWNNWCSIIDELESNREHCVTPAFFTLRNMLRDTSDIHGLHISWIRCAFVRILRDDLDAIVKWGLLEVLTLDQKLFNEELLSVVMDALNKTGFYEVEVNEEKPTVVKLLTTFLNHAEAQNTHLVTRFMVKASIMTWNPVCLFYVVHALFMVNRLRTVWKEVELEAVKSLAEMISRLPCPILRIGSQIELLEAMTHFATESLDLVTVGNTLSAFSTNEALNRGQLAWKRTSTWLLKLVKEDEAIRFLENISLQVTNGDPQPDLSIKSLPLMIMLFYDGHLALNSKVSPGFTALCNLLNCLIEDDPKFHATAELKIRAIEVLGHLVDVTMSKDCILNELLSNYADATLRWTLRNLQTAFDEASFDSMSTYVQITQRLFTKSSIITEKNMLDHIEKFQLESRNIIQDGEVTSNVKRFFAIKVLQACLTATSTSLRNYDFIGFLHKTYKNQLTQSSRDAERDTKICKENGKLRAKFESEYYKIVAELFLEYLKDKPVDEWLPNIDWVKEVLYLIQVGGTDVFVPLVGILSQIYLKPAIKPADMNDFKSAIKLCWKSILESNDCGSATEKILSLMLSSRFLRREKTRELAMKCIREVMGRGDDSIGQSVIVLKNLKRVKGKYLCHFYEVILACALCGTVPSCVQEIELQARSYVLGSYQEVYPNYLSAMNSNTSVVARAHAVTLLHKMITDDPAHAVKLFPLILEKLNKSQNVQDVHDSQTHRLKVRILQVLLVIQPILNESEIESLYTLLCNKILSESSQPSIRIMQEWNLIKIYLHSETLRSKLWSLFDQGQERRVASLYSVMSVVHHVAQLLSSDSQMDFIDRALEHIMPYCMSQESNVAVYAQVIATKLYDLATELSHPTITEKYGALRAALTKSLTHGNLKTNSTELQDDFYFKDFNPVADYTLQTLFYELPRLTNVSSDELVSPQMFEKFGFKESNNHPLKLLNLKNVMSEAKVSTHILKSLGSAAAAANGTFASQMNSSCGNQSVLVQKS